MQATVVVSAAIIHEGRILMVQEGKPASRGQWGLPGGRVEPGEPLVDAAVREVLEETGYDVRVTGMTRVLRYISQHGYHCVRFNFVAELLGGAERFDGREILDVRWRTPEDVAAIPDEDLRTSAIARAVIADAFAERLFPLEVMLDALAPGG